MRPFSYFTYQKLGAELGVLQPLTELEMQWHFENKSCFSYIVYVCVYKGR